MNYNVARVVNILRSEGNPRNVVGMARFGITSVKAFGVSAPLIRGLARKIGRDHELAIGLWSTEIHEARAMAALIGDPAKVTKSLMNSWVKDFDNWAVCDCACGVLFDKTPFAYEMAKKWTKRKEEFVRRAGFVMMASLAVHDKKASDSEFLKFLPIIERGATDDRNFVKKAVNWALRQIGKRNLKLNSAAIRSGKKIRRLNSTSARWIAADALRELESTSVQERLRKRKKVRLTNRTRG